jgi:hypothetical protein
MLQHAGKAGAWLLNCAIARPPPLPYPNCLKENLCRLDPSNIIHNGGGGCIVAARWPPFFHSLASLAFPSCALSCPRPRPSGYPVHVGPLLALPRCADCLSRCNAPLSSCGRRQVAAGPAWLHLVGPFCCSMPAPPVAWDGGWPAGHV